MSDKLFEIEKKMSRKEISENLRKIADGLERGKIELNSKNQSIELNPSENLEFEIDVEESKNEVSVEVEIEWKEGGKAEDLEIA